MSATIAMPQPAADLFSALGRRIGAESVLRAHEMLARRTTLRVGGPADLYLEAGNESDLREALWFCGETGTPWTMLGRGSNLLVRDGGIRGLVIRLGVPFGGIAAEGTALRCGAAARLQHVATEAKRASLAGFEFMGGIPGNIGGALRMNAGAMGSSTFEVAESVRFMKASGEIEERAASAIPAQYRSCAHFKDAVALSAVLRGTFADRSGIEERMKEYGQKRWKSQPSTPSAGCIFQNPGALPAGRLVEELGLKGVRVGGAVISELHGNFIVNEGNARARDVIELIERVQAAARRERGIELRTEVQIVGED